MLTCHRGQYFIWFELWPLWYIYTDLGCRSMNGCRYYLPLPYQGVGGGSPVQCDYRGLKQHSDDSSTLVHRESEVRSDSNCENCENLANRPEPILLNKLVTGFWNISGPQLDQHCPSDYEIKYRMGTELELLCTYIAAILIQYRPNAAGKIHWGSTILSQHRYHACGRHVLNLYQGCFPIMEQHLRTTSVVFSKFVTPLKQVCACSGSILVHYCYNVVIQLLCCIAHAVVPTLLHKLAAGFQKHLCIVSTIEVFYLFSTSVSSPYKKIRNIFGSWSKFNITSLFYKMLNEIPHVSYQMKIGKISLTWTFSKYLYYAYVSFILFDVWTIEKLLYLRITMIYYYRTHFFPILLRTETI